MEKRAPQVGLTVLGVSVLAALMGVGYLAQTGFSQLYAPAPGGNDVVTNAPRGNMPRGPVPEGESVWEDYPEEDLDYEPRLPERPGNFDVITRVGQFYEGRYEIEPRYTDHAAYPLWLASKRFESAAEFEAKQKEDEDARRKSGHKQKNKLRQYNVIINGLTIQRLKSGESAITNPKENGVRQSDLETFASVRKAHPERCYLVLVGAQLESLQSDKIEGGGTAAEILCYVQKPDGWKLVWWRKG